MLKRTKTQVIMADFPNLFDQYLQSEMNANSNRDDYDMIGDALRMGGQNSLAIDCNSRNDTRFPNSNDGLDDYVMLGEHYRSPFPVDMNQHDKGLMVVDEGVCRIIGLDWNTSDNELKKMPEESSINQRVAHRTTDKDSINKFRDLNRHQRLLV